jgi:ubiquinone/menaquinone biosynthesis C-methylase UbiE
MSDAIYTHGHHESVLRSHRWRTAENSAAYLLPHLEPGQRLLDVGSGPGTITADFVELVAPGRVTALEASDAALTLTLDELAARGLEADGLVGDIHHLDLPDDSFDVVHAHQVLQHVGDPVQALREMRRLCKSGGIVAARDSDYPAFTWYPEVPELDEWLALYLQAARANGGEPNAGRFLLAWAHEAGFTEVEPSASAWCFATPDRRELWGGMWEARILESDIARQIVDQGLGTTADLERISAGWRRWTDDPDAWFATLLGEIICRA